MEKGGFERRSGGRPSNDWHTHTTVDKSRVPTLCVSVYKRNYIPPSVLSYSSCHTGGPPPPLSYPEKNPTLNPNRTGHTQGLLLEK